MQHSRFTTTVLGAPGALLVPVVAAFALACVPPSGAGAIQRDDGAGGTASLATVSRSSASFLSPLEAELLVELNRARTNPRAYAKYLEERLAWFDGKVMREPGRRIAVETREGAAAVREAIAVLRRMRPQPPVAVSRGMSAGARDHVRDQGRTGATGHTGRDGSGAAERVARYGSWRESLSENIAYGPPTARDVIIGLIVDDGVPARGHRVNLFDPGIRVVGLSCGAHSRFRRMCVIVHANGYAEDAR